MPFVFPQKVLFKHCDPAGIVFYPRYFEMMNDCVEAFFDSCLDYSFAVLHEIGGVPTAEITTRFVAPSRLGDRLDIQLYVVRVGRTSVGLELRADCNGDLRFHTQSTLVHVDGRGKPSRWPDAVRQKLEIQQNRNNYGA